MNRLAVSAVALALASCSPAGHDSTETRSGGSAESRTYDLKDFDRVSARAGIELILKQGPFAVEARSHNGDLSKLAVNVDGSELVISPEVTIGGINISPGYTVTATAPTWTGIEGLAGVKIEGKDLQLENVSLEVAAGASAELSGTCKEITIKATAGAAVDAADFKCAAASAEAAAGAQVDIWASERAKAKAAAGASIEISGKPPSVEQDADISSRVKVE